MAVECQTVDCTNEAKLQCPTCIKLQVTDGSSWFCSQDCFKGSWSSHKAVHDSKRAQAAQLAYFADNPFPNYTYTGELRKAAISARRTVPDRIGRPDYADHPTGASICEMEARGKPIVVQTDEDITAMRVVAKLARQTLDAACAAVEVGVTTDELDRIVHETAIELDCYPSPLGYRGFPKSVCTSVNECICHGIPDMRPLVNGDLCNIDVTVYHRGYHGDLNETNIVGDAVSPEDINLIQNTYECITSAIELVKPGVKYREIGNTIEKIARRDGFSVVKSYCGHGIHKLFHTAPNVPHYAKNRATGVMQRGHTFTIEPMINAGKWNDELWPDQWTVVTSDGSRSAQFEQTLLCTDIGVDVLTKRPHHDGRPWFVDQLIKHRYPQAKQYTQSVTR